MGQVEFRIEFSSDVTAGRDGHHKSYFAHGIDNNRADFCGNIRVSHSWGIIWRDFSYWWGVDFYRGPNFYIFLEVRRPIAWGTGFQLNMNRADVAASVEMECLYFC
ncbi:MAG: hypothetical protein E4G98_03945 [Promethearchaeota archaeon]|nr:MAG: hypothetical protein E4G98_03945 [Candidatus Lokiarchaeota archaeon]